MSKSILIELELPSDWKQLKMPAALQHRLTNLLDRQQLSGKLSKQEKQEASALVELSEMLTLLKLRSRRSGGRAAR